MLHLPNRLFLRPLSVVDIAHNGIDIFTVIDRKRQNLIVIEVAFRLAEMDSRNVIDVDDITFVNPQKIKRQRVLKVLERFVGIDHFAVDEFDIGGIVVGFEVDDVLQRHKLVVAVRFDADGCRCGRDVFLFKFEQALAQLVQLQRLEHII